MTRATNGPATRQRRNRVLKRAKGFRQGRRNLFKQAMVTGIRADAFAFAGRQQKKRFGLGSACIGGGQGAAVIVEAFPA